MSVFPVVVEKAPRPESRGAQDACSSLPLKRTTKVFVPALQ
jgi:hypothetical protein